MSSPRASRWIPLAAALATAGAGSLATQGAEAASRAPKLTKVRCVPKTLAACKTSVRLTVGQRLQLSGSRFVAGQRVSFRWSRGALATKLVRDRTGWTVRVPPGTATGRVSVTVTDRAGRRSNALAIAVVAKAVESTPSIPSGQRLSGAFDGDGMWIWYLDKSERGDLDAIAARAKAAGMTTVFVKSADGATPWSQFTPALVAGLHARGLKACAWQFVYGNEPEAEAEAAAESVRAGADCFVIDAETHYEGRYAAAQRYVAALRAAVGADYPLGLTSFPYVDYHPRLPYSVFLGPGGAQVNLPQVYWRDIGGSVDAVSARTVAANRIYEAPIAPLGQTYASPPAGDLRRFRTLWKGYGSTGLSWWSWQATPSASWAVLSETLVGGLTPTDPGWPGLDERSSGDQVIWLQQHLATFDRAVPIDGKFGASTTKALRAFQASKGLTASGETDAATWQAVLALDVTPADWS